MKILVISNMYPSVKDPVYGTFVQTFVEQMKVLNTEGKTNIIVIKGRDGEYGRKLFKYVKFYISILFSLLFRKHDIVYVHTITYPIIPIRLALLFRKLPLVFNVHGGDVLTHGKIAGKMKQYARPVLRNARMIVSPSFFFKEILLCEFPELEGDKIFVSSSGGVGVEFYKERPKVKNEIPIIGYISRIDKGKGWDTLIDALSILRERGVSYTAIIAGRGTLEKEMMKKIRDLYLDNLIKYIGPIPYHSLPEIYCTLDLFIFPTCLEESLGLVGLEAMACEVPVIGSYIGGLKDYIKDKENGFSLKSIAVNEKKIDKEKKYSILLTDITMSILKKLYPECEITQLKDTTLSSAWAAAMSKGQQPSAPEDYIEVEK